MANHSKGPTQEQSRSSWGENESYNGTIHAGAQSLALPLRPSRPTSQTRRSVGGGQWQWDSQYRDYVQERDGRILKFSEYQIAALESDTQGTSRPSTSGGLTISFAPNPHQEDHLDGQLQDSVVEAASTQSPAVDEQPGRIRRPYESPLDPRFRVVEKPKRFFAIGRVFKTVWFEPGSQAEGSTASADADWSAACPPFHDEKPFAKFRWFLVVRKRLHHSLCFAITTFGGRAATKASRGRARDFVVLYRAGIEPPEPWSEEGIERGPLAVIIEEGQQYISPAARVDCGRIYTVEDNLRVMKIGRIHPDSLGALEEYYKESVS